MAPPSHKGSRKAGSEEQDLRSRLAAAEDALAAIQAGQIDALVISSPRGKELLTLAGAENGYRAFVEAMTEGAVTASHDGTILYCNRAFAELVGRPLETVIGSSMFALVSPEERDVFEALLRSSQQNRGRAEMRLSGGDGTLVPVLVSLTNFQEYGSRAICMVVTDLTEQKRQEQVIEAGRLPRLILDQAMEAIAVCDSTGCIILASKALHELCGCNPLLRPFDEVVSLDEPGGQRENKTKFHLSSVLRGDRYRCEEVLVRVEGREPVHMLLSAGPIMLPGAEAAGCVVTLFDIEDRKRAEDALRRTEKLAATGRLAAMIAHEINNPLEAITNLLFLISQSPELSPAANEYARLAQAELARVAHITKQTLAFHRGTHGPGPVRVPELIDSVLYLYERRIHAKHIELCKEIEFEGEIHGFANELRQVVSNLVENAVEACPVGGRMRLRAYRSSEWNNSHLPGVRIVVGDNGPGIPETESARIFEPFYTTKGERGTGLGLWVTQGIVAKHGGFIHMRSSTDQLRSGTVFSVFFPQHAATLLEDLDKSA